MSHLFKPFLLSFKSLGSTKDVASLHAFADLIESKHLSCPSFQNKEESNILLFALHNWSTYLKGWDTESFSKDLDKKTQKALGVIVGEMLNSNLSDFFSKGEWDDLWTHAFRISSPELWEQMYQHQKPDWSKLEEPFINHDGVKDDGVKNNEFSTLQWALRLGKTALLDFAKSKGWNPKNPDQMWQDAWTEQSLKWLIKQNYYPPQDPQIAIALLTSPRANQTKISPIRRQAYKYFIELFSNIISPKQVTPHLGEVMFNQSWLDLENVLKLHHISPTDPTLLKEVLECARMKKEMVFFAAFDTWKQHLKTAFNIRLENDIPFGYAALWESSKFRERTHRYFFNYDFFNNSKWLSSFEIPPLYPLFKKIQEQESDISSPESLNLTLRALGQKWLKEQPMDVLYWCYQVELEKIDNMRKPEISKEESQKYENFPGLELVLQEAVSWLGTNQSQDWSQSEKTLWSWLCASNYQSSEWMKKFNFLKLDMDAPWPDGDPKLIEWALEKLKSRLSLEDQAKMENKRLNATLPTSSKNAKTSLRI